MGAQCAPLLGGSFTAHTSACFGGELIKVVHPKDIIFTHFFKFNLKYLKISLYAKRVVCRQAVRLSNLCRIPQNRLSRYDCMTVIFSSVPCDFCST